MVLCPFIRHEENKHGQVQQEDTLGSDNNIKKITATIATVPNLLLG